MSFKKESIIVIQFTTERGEGATIYFIAQPGDALPRCAAMSLLLRLIKLGI